MCYSALVKANSKSLGLTYQARIQIDLFDDLFTARLNGSGAKIPRAMEKPFMESAKSFGEKRIQKAIREFTAQEMEASKAELDAQTKRLLLAERALLTKTTKKAQNDQRIAGEKIKKLTRAIESLNDPDYSDDHARIYPGMYAPLITEENGERVVKPFRYLLRPRGQSADFDRKFNGSYNARRDRLQEVFWWKSVFGRNHGAMEIKAFYENVKLHHFENRNLRAGEEEQNLILKFEPVSLREMLVPCIWDRNEADGTTLHSFALITDEPNPEVAAAGHDRTPIILKPEYLGRWLTPGNDLSSYEAIFDDKQPTTFEHEIAA